MKSITCVIGLIEVALWAALPIFIASTLYLISVVKKSDFNMIKDTVTNPVIPNLDLSFFRRLQEKYLLVKKNKIPALVNRFSFYVLIGGFFLMFFLVIVQELTRY